MQQVLRFCVEATLPRALLSVSSGSNIVNISYVKSVGRTVI